MSEEPIREIVANVLCAAGICGGDTSSAPCEGARNIADAVLLAISSAGMVIVPREATEKMWGGLARDLVMWNRFEGPTGNALHRHLKMLGREIPDWLTKEIPDVDHVPPKGTVAFCIYRAMISDSTAPHKPQDGGKQDG